MAGDRTVDRRYPFTIDQYERMARVLEWETRTELLDGIVYDTPPSSPLQASVVGRITRRLYRSALGEASIRNRNPLLLPPRSEPEPDIVVVRRHEDRHADAHPTAEDALLVIEVADTSLALDQQVKVPIYAAQHVVEVWIVDLTAGVVHVYTDPSDKAYRTVHTLGRDDELVPTAIKEVRIAVSDVL